ncbi:SH3 domain-containing protein [Celeribacter naphthalenivorans]|uniref:SH3 domain-containing protein n=1 Tax=Celeribacter naphthalenivorans TaxID=1614694 RepID=UPI001CF95645|nr:SH3 domain-containing protein [Celeribacter naphthalenivorans]
MLRLLAMTSVGLWASFMVFGRDLSPQEQAALDLRRAEKVSVFAGLSDRFSEAFGTDVKRQGAYVPTLAELNAQSTVAPTAAPSRDSGLVQLASAQIGTPDITPTSATTTVAHPEKMAALLVDPVMDPTEAASDMILREVTAARVNVRSGPSTVNPVMGQVVRTEIVRVISPEENGWVKISVEGDGVEGYMAARFLADVSH